MERPDDRERVARANESLTRELLDAYEEIDLLHTLNGIFATSADIDEMGGRLLEEAAAALRADAAFLVYTGEGMEQIEPALRGVEAEEVQAFVSVAGSRLLAGEPALLDRAEAEGYAPRPLLCVPLRSPDGIFGALGLLRRTDSSPFSAGDLKTAEILAGQASAVIVRKRNLDLAYLSARLRQSNDALQALLEIGRELTRTLDLDRVLAAVVNLSSRVAAYDRAAVALKDGTRWRLRAVSGQEKVDRGRPELAELERLLARLGERESDLLVEAGADGQPHVEPPDLQRHLAAYFEQSGMRALYAIRLADEDGLLGILAFERAVPPGLSERERELVAGLANQATVALRNAQLYRQVPLLTLLEPMLARQRWLRRLPWSRRAAGAAAVVVLGALAWIPFPLRVGGNAILAPARTVTVSTLVPGRLAEIEAREGDQVIAGQALARLDDREYRLRREEARTQLVAAERLIAQAEAAGDPRRAAVERERLERLQAELTAADVALAETVLRAPEAGVILTPRLRERRGERLEAGAALCTLAALDALEAEIGVPESEAAYVREGMPAEVRLYRDPAKTLHGEVHRLHPAAEERDGEIVVVARVPLTNPDGVLLPGMGGRARIVAGRGPLGYCLLRRPARWVRSWIWF